ncbi:MAG: hypothetical protein E6767_16350 [Dysgonomonas sp.]|nr:hypothetical protein [Dysgonomonas sp.]
MKKMISFLIIFFGCVALYAQTASEKEDVIQLKNGKSIRGIIVKRQFGTVSIEVIDSLTQKKKTIIFQQREIANIKERVQTTIQSDTIKVHQEMGIVSGQQRNISSKNMPTENIQDMIIPEQSPLNTLNPIIQPGNQLAEPVFSEPVQIQGNMKGSAVDYFDPYSVPRPKRRERIWNRDIRGFRGFVDYAYVQGIGLEKNHRMEYSTSLGFQFNPIFYVGVGTAYSMNLSDKKHASLPVFLNPRINFIDENTTPFLDLRFGYSVAEGKGIFGSIGSGVSFTRKGKNAFNLGIVYSFQRVSYYRWSEKKPTEREKANVNYSGLALRLSFEFGIGR